MVRILIFIIILQVIYRVLTAWPQPYSFYIIWFSPSVFNSSVLYNFCFHCAIYCSDIWFFNSCCIFVNNCYILFFLIICIMFTGFVLDLKIFGAFVGLIDRHWIIVWTLIIPLFPYIIIIWYIKECIICICISVILNSNSTFN